MLSQECKLEKGTKSLRGGNEDEHIESEEVKSYEKQADCRCGERFEAEAKESCWKQETEEEEVLMEG